MRGLILGLVLAVGLGVPGLAQTPEEEIIASLEEQGYSVVMRDRTWLGRIWLLVENGDLRREIVFNPSTGEILRDYSVMMVAEAEKTSRSGDVAVTVMSTQAPPAVMDTRTQETSAGTFEIGDPLLVIPAPGK